jgi:hypothetical protein
VKIRRGGFIQKPLRLKQFPNKKPPLRIIECHGFSWISMNLLWMGCGGGAGFYFWAIALPAIFG